MTNMLETHANCMAMNLSCVDSSRARDDRYPGLLIVLENTQLPAMENWLNNQDLPLME